jgi:hypothetical protein
MNKSYNVGELSMGTSNNSLIGDQSVGASNNSLIIWVMVVLCLMFLFCSDLVITRVNFCF